ncbi:cellulase family glycosylhydrolase [Streptomyces sp. NPDC058745]|uniref:cellulase family glycosylhydrolase n=1 Tax=Streptomyces sp. NPDC058745 TaxID=3346621 RepID=UPI00369661D1
MRHPPRLPALLTGAALLTASCAFAVVGTATGAAAVPACTVQYSVVGSWAGGFQGSVTVTNGAAALNGWSLGFAFLDGQRISQGWGAKWSQTDAGVTAANESWNASLGTGASVTAGFIASWSGSHRAPAAFTLNGAVCNEDPGPTEPTPTPTGPTPTPTPTEPTDPPDPVTGAPELGVTGNRLTDRNGATRRLLGVNRSGGEFMCVQGHGFFDGPVDNAAVRAIADWKANTVRIPLNEECWLGHDNVKPEYRGAAYVDAVKGLVDRVLAHGMTPVVELHWTYGQYTGNSAGCSDVHATCQKPMPNARYTPAFWTSVANTFKHDRRIVFDLFNEPYPDRATTTAAQAWTCWRDGGTCPGIGYEVAGMQDLVDAVRATGSRNVVLVPGIAYSNDLSQWLAHAPTDPAGLLAAAWHVYNFNTCANEACWDSTLAPVSARVPLVAGEIGENTCGHGFIDRVMTWFDDRGLSYLGWTWNTWNCSSGPALITSYDGTPTSFGIGLRDRLRALN